ncbi:Ig-like domain-containing protein [Flavobacterium silvaticum]|uniref:Ig-like domain-containing protein n=1 Tax=Flavobacterium silvaticum TaxID=1852020 RepID=A0A972JF76_9FLAO|nr:Ig-like domain-containing protein [Flavobacterium silvaticum]NMH27659.1 Ig-like domain-containing protein [Flavobacterium silvaticum]
MRSSLSLLLILLLVLTGCAKRGSITGGLKDTIPPVLTGSIPKNYSTSFDGKVIKLSFDELVKLKDINKQLVVSPPMKTPPVISPTTASKLFTITIKDTLKPNTTYSFNFGQSIQDNNEGNMYPQFKYVFSTGTYVDSLQLAGRITDAYNKKADNFVSVMLYEVDENFTDSIIYKKPPRYVTNTLDSLTTWKLENLKEGKYLLIALKDKSGNNTYQPKSDKIGFRKELITLPNDTLFQIDLFKEDVKFKALKPTLDAGHKLLMGYEGNPENVEVTVKNGEEILKSEVTKFPDKDSVNIWFPKIKADSLGISIKKGDYIKNFYTKIKDQKKDSLSFKKVGKFSFRDNLKIESSIPVDKIDESKITLIRKDSSKVEFKTEYDKFTKQITFIFDKQPSEKYSMRLFPGAITDFYGTVNDTLKYSATTKELSEFGNLRVKLENANRFPIVVELTDAKGNVQATAYTEKETTVDFNALEPNKYTLRIIYDDNKNKRWDSGNYLQKIQPEEVIYFPKEIEVRSNWDVEQPFTLP